MRYNEEEILGFRVERKKIKNLSINISEKGELFIKAPLNMSKENIEGFIHSKKSWIDKYQKTINNRLEIYNNLDHYENGTYIFYLGKKYTLRIFEGSNNIYISNNDLIIHTDNSDKSNVKNIVYNFYYKNANIIIKDRFDYYMNLMNISNVKLSIATMKKKWGFCVPLKRRISLNIELIKKSINEIDSVIVHELVHLKHPNHSKEFYYEIDKYFKDYKLVNKKLNNIF